MPELPEVENARRSLARRLEGRSIVSHQVRFPGVLRCPDCAQSPRLPARYLESFRHGKVLYLLFEADRYLFARLGMTGGFYFRTEAEPLRDHSHVEFVLDNGERMVFRDPRRFGGLWWYEGDQGAQLPPLLKLGPDALTVPKERFVRLFQTRGRMIKPLLLDQTVLSGLGNIYIDECLFQARIHPTRRSDRVSAAKLGRLWNAVQETLQEAIERGGSSIRDYSDSEGKRGAFQDRHLVYDKEGAPCPRCGAPIRRIVVVQRGTWVCPKCQRP